MRPSSVTAASTSRLHADVIVTRLTRAGIARDKISALFPESSRPNCADCWLVGASKPADYEGERMVIAGPMHKQVSITSETQLIRSFQKMGLGVNDACSHAERLSKGQILLCVQTDDSSEIAIAWHTFRELEAEGIALGMSAHAPEKRTWFGRRRTQESRAHASPSLAYGVAV